LYGYVQKYNSHTGRILSKMTAEGRLAAKFSGSRLIGHRYDRMLKNLKAYSD